MTPRTSRETIDCFAAGYFGVSRQVVARLRLHARLAAGADLDALRALVNQQQRYAVAYRRGREPKPPWRDARGRFLDRALAAREQAR